MSILSFILKRILYAIPILLAVSVIGFTLMRFDIQIGPYTLDNPLSTMVGPQQLVIDWHWYNPTDPLANLRQNPQISKETIQQEEERMGLKLPLYEQYWRWLSHLLKVDASALSTQKPWEFFKPDLGRTYANEDVAWLVATRARNSLLLNVLTILFTWLVAVPLGVYTAVRWRSLSDRAMTALSAMGMAAPSFVLAILLAMVAVQTGWFPLGGIRSGYYDTLSLPGKIWDVAHHLMLPVIVLSIGGVAGLQRQMRGNLLDILGADYIRTARAKGLSETVVLYKHAVRNAINPLITLMGYEFSALLSGALLVEYVLDFPGIGQLTFAAAVQGDTNLVMTSMLMSSAMLILGNLLADILLNVVDPRVSLEAA